MSTSTNLATKGMRTDQALCAYCGEVRLARGLKRHQPSCKEKMAEKQRNPVSMLQPEDFLRALVQKVMGGSTEKEYLGGIGRSAPAPRVGQTRDPSAAPYNVSTNQPPPPPGDTNTVASPEDNPSSSSLLPPLQSTLAPWLAPSSSVIRNTTQGNPVYEQVTAGEIGTTPEGKRKAEYPAVREIRAKRPRVYLREAQLVYEQPAVAEISERSPSRWPPHKDVLDFAALLLELGVTEGSTAERFFYHINNMRTSDESKGYPTSVESLGKIWEGAARALTTVHDDRLSAA